MRSGSVSASWIREYLLSFFFSWKVSFVDFILLLGRLFVAWSICYQSDSLTSPRSELSRLIATDRLHCSIEQVHGVIESTRPGKKTAQ
jgi:hypothetical protein